MPNFCQPTHVIFYDKQTHLTYAITPGSDRLSFGAPETPLALNGQFACVARKWNFRRRRNEPRFVLPVCLLCRSGVCTQFCFWSSSACHFYFISYFKRKIQVNEGKLVKKVNCNAKIQGLFYVAIGNYENYEGQVSTSFDALASPKLTYLLRTSSETSRYVHIYTNT